MKYVLVYCLILIGFMSCKKDSFDSNNMQDSFEYLPLKPGTERIYKYTFIQIDVPTAIHDTSIWYIRETIADTIVDTLDYKLFRIVREKRRADTLPWEPATIWSISKHNRMLVRSEENVPYLILQFPEKLQNSWNGNVYNTLDEEKYTYSSLNEIDTIQNTPYDSVMVITQKYFKSIYTYQFKEERYAYHVGLISKTNIDIESQPTDYGGPLNLSLPIEQRITKGTIEKLELLSIQIPN